MNPCKPTQKFWPITSQPLACSQQTSTQWLHMLEEFFFAFLRAFGILILRACMRQTAAYSVVLEDHHLDEINGRCCLMFHKKNEQVTCIQAKLWNQSLYLHTSSHQLEGHSVPLKLLQGASIACCFQLYLMWSNHWIIIYLAILNLFYHYIAIQIQLQLQDEDEDEDGGNSPLSFMVVPLTAWNH